MNLPQIPLPCLRKLTLIQKFLLPSCPPNALQCPASLLIQIPITAHTLHFGCGIYLFSLPQSPIWNSSQLSCRMFHIPDSSGCFLRIRIIVQHGWQLYRKGDVVPSTAFYLVAYDAMHPINDVRLDYLIKNVVTARSLHCKGMSSL